MELRAWEDDLGQPGSAAGEAPGGCEVSVGVGAAALQSYPLPIVDPGTQLALAPKKGKKGRR